MAYLTSTRRSMLMCGAAMAMAVSAAPVMAQERVATVDIPAQPMASALRELARQSGANILFAPDAVQGLHAHGLQTSGTAEEAAQLLVAGTDLQVVRDPTGSLVVRRFAPQSTSASDGADGTVEALIVTAQKREEDIQDVPIAISAFSQEALERSQVAGGPDLITQVPNMTFTKTNFSSYSIQLRGIGTQAISATTDAAVAVAFNNTPFIRNRFFEQEFYDLQRVEVLRGPQGTLYGRNATAGVVNIISQKPKFAYEAKLSGDIANYSSTRIEGMINVPLFEDVVALRVAGAWTKREGYSTNDITGNPIDGRDLWSTRVGLRFSPNDRLDANLIWEHFEENDDRLRSGKQLCHTHEVTSVTAIDPGADPMVLDGRVRTFATTHFMTLPEGGQPLLAMGVQGTFSQGCAPASLYSPDSFEVPNGLSLPYYSALSAVALPAALDDPYVSRSQSHDLRAIESTVDPDYRAKADVVELQVSFDLNDALTVTSETAYSSDFIFSLQDYNRFNTAPGAWSTTSGGAAQLVARKVLSEDGVFCDPQIGCSDRMVAVDLSTARSRQFSQELRLGSSYDGPFNFSLGGNFLRYDTNEKYYVFINSLSLFAASQNPLHPEYVQNVTDNFECLPRGPQPPNVNTGHLLNGCQYIDPNPIGSLNDRGHNYFLSNNPYKLISYAVFGEAYYQVTDALKITAGLRWTVDKKEAPRIPSWVIAADTIGYPVVEVVEQEWRKPTGRLTIDWKPDLAFTDETLLYASYAHGYKAGGMNPPATGLVCYAGCGDYVAEWNARDATKPKTFDPEYVNAYELGAKNTLLDGRVTVNVAAFYYDYQGYQLSQIVDRSAISQNFDAKIWGLEIEADWRPLDNLRLGFKGGYENTEVADGMKAIDLMDRTAGTPGWVVVSPFPTFPSNCVLPAFLFAGVSGFYNGSAGNFGNPELHNLGNPGGGGPGGCEYAYLFGLDPVTLLPYVPNPTVADHPQALPSNPGYPGWDPTLDYGNNHGEGFFKDLSGNELPNAPHFTVTLTGDYTIPLPNDWLATLHTDLYYQSEAWTRIFNTEGYDKLKAYTNVNVAAIFTNDAAGWKVMAYVKNVFDRDNITGAFLNSDDTGLTTNVFMTEPRLFGLRVTKDFQGGPWWTGADPASTGPFPLTVEIGGMVQRQDAPYEKMAIDWAEGVAPELDTSSLQNRDLDWGDGRSVKLTWRPHGSPWMLSGAARYGRTNGGRHDIRGELEHTGEKICGVPSTHDFYYFLCDPRSQYYDQFERIHHPTTLEWSDGNARDREAHDIIDFSAGRDVGLGALARSTVSAGLRHAKFESSNTLHARAIVNWQLSEGWVILGGSYVEGAADLRADREFQGTGPMLSWDAATALLGTDETGHLNLDWSLGAGTLFGKQETRIKGEERMVPHAGSLKYPPLPGGMPVVTPRDDVRQQDVTVPVVDLSLGLSYEAGRIKVGAGYRWERYFEVLDVGFQDEEAGDRTIDGPYFKVAVGFGG